MTTREGGREGPTDEQPCHPVKMYPGWDPQCVHGFVGNSDASLRVSQKSVLGIGWMHVVVIIIIITATKRKGEGQRGDKEGGGGGGG